MHLKRETIDELRSIYTPGTRVRLEYMDDEQAPPEGTCGTVTGVDAIGSILVHWDNGSSLNLLYGHDRCSIISQSKKAQNG